MAPSLLLMSQALNATEEVPVCVPGFGSQHSAVQSWPVEAGGRSVWQVFPHRKLSNDPTAVRNVVRKRKESNVLPMRSAPPFPAPTNVLPPTDPNTGELCSSTERERWGRQPSRELMRSLSHSVLPGEAPSSPHRGHTEKGNILFL